MMGEKCCQCHTKLYRILDDMYRLCDRCREGLHRIHSFGVRPRVKK